MDRQWFDKSPYVNQSLFNPEWIYGVSVLVHIYICKQRNKERTLADDLS